MKIPTLNLTNSAKGARLILFGVLGIGFIIVVGEIVYYTVGGSNGNTINRSAVVDSTKQAKGEQNFENAINDVQKQNPQYVIVTHLPYTASDGKFSIDYSYAKDTFIITLIGSDKTDDQREALTWLNKYNVDINTLHIVYQAP